MKKISLALLVVGRNIDQIEEEWRSEDMSPDMLLVRDLARDAFERACNDVKRLAERDPAITFRWTG